jgi:hypothetical protein
MWSMRWNVLRESSEVDRAVKDIPVPADLSEQTFRAKLYCCEDTPYRRTLTIEQSAQELPTVLL